MPKPLPAKRPAAGRLAKAPSPLRGRPAGPAHRHPPPIQIITPGWGSSGYYSPEVLERAAQNR
jgi:hypothetical protein